MKIGVIDIQTKALAYLQSEFSHLGSFSSVVVGETDKLATIAHKAVNDNYDAIAINIECKYEKAKRSALRGIELIYWLRLKENYLGTIITYGFLSSAQVLRLKPEYVVLNAPENYHFSLPLLQGLQNFRSTQTLKSTNEYAKYLKPFINLEAIRHSSANYYALKNLRGIHKQITSTEIEIAAPEALTTMEVVYDGYYGTDNKSQLEKEAESNLKKKIEKTENEVKELIAISIPKKGNKWKRNITEHPTEAYYHYKEILESMNQEKVQVSNPKRRSFSEYDYQARELDVKKYKIVVDQNKNRLTQKEGYLSQLKKSLANDSIEEIAKKRIEELQEKIAELKTLNGKVVLVDDLAEEGWYSFYNEIIGDTIELENEEIPSQKVEFDATPLATSILSKKPNLVLLDMRLYEGEEDALYPSGIQILKELRKQNKIIPIIVCSASNRGSVINLIHQEGANFYWLKEGADLEFAFDESINNYERLIHLLKTTLSVNQVKIQNLYNRFQKRLMLSEETLWWEKKDWGYSLTITNHLKSVYYELIPQITEVEDKSSLFGIIKKGFINYSNYLLKLESQNKLPGWENCASSISLLSHILEYIHRIDVIRNNFNELKYQEEDLKTYSTKSAHKIISGYPNRKKTGQEKFWTGRFDKNGAKLIELRNKASHFEGAFKLTNTDVLHFYESVLNYLITPNECYVDKQYFEKNGFQFKDRECNIKV